ncbi:MAG: hypothetical protein QME79_06800 [Bacillota bacterium]|nr:hypothetical protein [Bacillota bacterium]
MESDAERTQAAADTAHLRERMTSLLCQEGLPRATALIVSLLIFTPGAWSIAELAEELRVSKASVSLGTRFMEQQGLIERVFVPGERKVRFRVAPDALEKAWQQEMNLLKAFSTLLREGATTVSPAQVAVRRRLTEFADFYDFLVEHIPELIAHWKGEKDTVFTDGEEG